MKKDENSPEYLAKLKKEVAYYKRRYDKLLKDYEASDKIRDNYDIFYKTSLVELDKKNSELEGLNKKLEILAMNDPLTQLANRKYFDTHIEQSIGSIKNESHRKLALFFFDLDGFKAVNDSYGHNVGDQVLIRISHRLKNILRGDTFLARISGDEFVIVLNDLEDLDDASYLANNVLASCSEPIPIEQSNIVLSASIGIAIYPNDLKGSTDNPISKLKQFADLAMYKAKSMGKNQYCFYDQGLTEKAKSELELSNILRQDIKTFSFEPFLQPLYGIEEDKIIGFEALARWPKPEGGYLGPSTFMPLIEKMNLLVEIDFIIYEKTCELLSKHDVLLNSVKYISVNFSVQSFSHKFCYERVVSIINKYQVPPCKITIELTEDSFLHEDNEALNTIYRLKKLGFRLALDDFGTGYSALSYLNRLPLDIIKIDQYFVKMLPNDTFSDIIVDHLISMFKKLGFTIVAEGVEELPQLMYLQERSCDILQGYYFSEPLPAMQAISLLTQQENKFSFVPIPTMTPTNIQSKPPSNPRHI